eukprot:364282-Chlamydomonas_euryale.AAC.38
MIAMAHSQPARRKCVVSSSKSTQKWQSNVAACWNSLTANPRLLVTSMHDPRSPCCGYGLGRGVVSYVIKSRERKTHA